MNFVNRRRVDPSINLKWVLASLAFSPVPNNILFFGGANICFKMAPTKCFLRFVITRYGNFIGKIT